MSSDVERTDFAQKLHQLFTTVRPPEPSNHGRKSFFVSEDLRKCTQVFVRVDAVKKSLQHPYDGPFEVLDKDEKTFDILIGGKRQRISIDRLKPAFICSPGIADYLLDADKTVKVTPSGHRVRFLV